MNCPECGSESVSIDTVGENLSPTRSLQDHVLRAAAGDSLEFVRTCWTCGWEERRGLEVTNIETESGDEAVHRSQSLRQELETVVDEIDDPEILQRVLIEARRIHNDHVASSEENQTADER